MLIIGGSGSGKTNLLLHLIENQPDIDKIYLYVKDPYESKYQYLINKRECVGMSLLNRVLACSRAYVLACSRAWRACVCKCVLVCLICFAFQYLNLKILTAKNCVLG